ncbi:hypothetical protein FZ983_20100 [Azospirillum sp. B21]|nr:hypothetical protein FZ983_20100 [Azospirillum sp. B21]
MKDMMGRRAGQSNIKILFLSKETSHPREGGNPSVSAAGLRSLLDPRLRGDDGRRNPSGLGCYISLRSAHAPLRE